MMQAMRVAVAVRGLGFCDEIVFPSGVLSLTGTDRHKDSVGKEYTNFTRGSRYADEGSAKDAIRSVFESYRSDFLHLLRHADEEAGLDAVEWRVPPTVELDQSDDPLAIGLPWRLQIRSRFSCHLRNGAVDLTIVEFPRGVT